jgi:hypothetical protein
MTYNIDWTSFLETGDGLFRPYFDAFSVTTRLVYPSDESRLSKPYQSGVYSSDGSNPVGLDTNNPYTDIDTLFTSKNGGYLYTKVLPLGNLWSVDAQIIGYIPDLPNLQRADYLICNYAMTNLVRNKFNKVGQPIVVGLRNNLYIQNLAVYA